MRVFLPSIRDLAERQAELLWHVAGFIRDYSGDGLLKTTDADVEAAAAALASTHDTAARGLIYEQRPGSLPAQRLAADLERHISKLPGDRVSSFERDLAAVFRSIERGAREAAKSFGGDAAYQALLRRLMVPSKDATEPQSQRSGLAGPSSGSSLIIP